VSHRIASLRLLNGPHAFIASDERNDTTEDGGNIR